MQKFLVIFILLLLSSIGFPNKLFPKKIDNTYELIEEKTDWDYLIDALIIIESNGNDTIINYLNYGGCLQIGTIYVEDVNRISKITNPISFNEYQIDDRLNRIKSLEMFAIIQEWYNPKKNIKKAIKLHNPTASEKYMNKVLKLFWNLNPKVNMGGDNDNCVPP